MILGSFLGDCELRISISENTSPKSLNSSIKVKAFMAWEND